MAGIGFELYKILHKGTIGSILKVLFLGTIIVAGPWVLSVISIYIIQKFIQNAISENPVLFTVTIVYVYAFSLFIFGGVHYLFSRYIADMLYIEDNESIPSALITIFLIVVICSIIISIIFIFFNDFDSLGNPFLYKFSLVFLFTVVNLIWIMLVYVALLKEYNKIFIAYLMGMTASIGGVFYFGRIYGVGGALLGYDLGQLLIVVLLLMISHRSYPIKLFNINRELLSYFKKFRYLFFIGLFFNMGIWIDKIIYWFVFGTNIKGTLYYYFIDYDIPVFLAYLSMIPGLVYFLVVTEPIFHRAYSIFVKNILQDNLARIKQNKEMMLKNLEKGLFQLILFQGVWTIGLLLNAKEFLSIMGYQQIKIYIMNILIVAVFFHMMSLTLQIYLMYLELRIQAFLSTFIYFISNAIFTLLFLYAGFYFPGVSYLLAAMLSTIYSGYKLYKKIPIIDYILFTKT